MESSRVIVLLAAVLPRRMCDRRAPSSLFAARGPPAARQTPFIPEFKSRVGGRRRTISASCKPCRSGRVALAASASRSGATSSAHSAANT